MLIILKILIHILVVVGVLLIAWTDNMLNINIFIGFLCCGVAWVLNFIKLIITAEKENKKMVNCFTLAEGETMKNTNKYNYYITLINMCNTLDNADALTTEIADDETISHADYCELYNLLVGKYQRLNEGLKAEQIPLIP